MKIFAPKDYFFHENIRTRFIEDTNEKYAVREDGVILSYATKNVKVLSDSYSHNGYKKINIHYVNGTKTKRIHRLVAEAFIHNKEPEKYDQVDHIDMNKDNNHYSNLRWCTGKMNKGYSCKIKHGEDWEPKYVPTPEEIAQRKEASIKRKQEKRDNMLYGSLETMIEHIGINVSVNGIEYVSAGSAAKYIVESEKDHRGIERKKSTVSKEIRRMANGQRKPGVMYGRYDVKPIVYTI